MHAFLAATLIAHGDRASLRRGSRANYDDGRGSSLFGSRRREEEGDSDEDWIRGDGAVGGSK